jgi:beta-lactamase superfamily II metal-dependent hydrolase
LTSDTQAQAQAQAQQSDNRLKIFILGQRLGESIIIKTPRGDIGVVDSYARESEDESSNPTITRLKSLKMDRLKFIALTHPHQDHFRGLPSLFKAFSGKVAEFWRPPFDKSNLVSLFQSLDAEVRAESSYPIKEAMRGAAKTLAQLLSIAAEEGKRHSMRSRLMQENCILLQEPEHQFYIKCMAPCAAATLDYQRGLFNRALQGASVGASEHHNMISSVIEIRFGSWVGILGGDAERRAWEQILSCEELDWAVVNSTFVKVSHHGSPTGSFDAIWSRVRSKPFHAAVTCFAAQGLPTQGGLLSIGSNGGIVHCTSKSLASRTPGNAVAPIPIHLVPSQNEAGEIHVTVDPGGSTQIAHIGAAGVVQFLPTV